MYEEWVIFQTQINANYENGGLFPASFTVASCNSFVLVRSHRKTL